MNELKEVTAAFEFVESLIKRKRVDADAGHGPLWHGWALREAFLKGVEWRDKPMNKQDLEYDIKAILIISHVASELPEKPKTASEVLQVGEKAKQAYFNDRLLYAKVNKDTALIMNLIDKYQQSLPVNNEHNILPECDQCTKCGQLIKPENMDDKCQESMQR